MDKHRFSLLTLITFILSLSILSTGVRADPLAWPAVYPKAQLITDNKITQDEVQLPLSHLRRIDGLLQPGKTEWVIGTHWWRTYEVPRGHRPKEIFAYYKQQVLQGDVELLFICSRHACGSSNHWANKIFSNATLYGPEKNQNYLIARQRKAEGDVFVLVYVMQRGNKRNYAHIEWIETASLQNKPITPTASTLLVQLNGQGVINLPISMCERPHREYMDVLAAAFKKDSTLMVDVVARISGDDQNGCGQKTIENLLGLGVRPSQLNLLVSEQVEGEEEEGVYFSKRVHSR